MAKTVLIIEDRREQIVFIANKLLKPEGWDVITARDGELGLRKAIEEKPDLIITDLKLPKMHGLDVLEELNRRDILIPTIVMTFHGSEETAIRAFRLGAIDYLIKPFQIEDMMSAIDRALQVGSAGRAPAAVAETAMAEKLASQQREIQRLTSLLQQQESALQEQQPSAHQAQVAAIETDVARWQALLKTKETTLANLKKQAIAQSQMMSQEINSLRAQLAEKEAIVTSLQSQIARARLGPGEQPESSDLVAQLAEKERALAQANKLVKSLTRVITVQQKAIEKHREEAERLAHELHILATGIQMLGQGLGNQAHKLTSALPGEE
jgi:DNA-binding response OmpR family regulator